MRTFTDEELMAYADGELDAAEAKAVETAAEQDPEIAARIALFNDSRAILREAFGKTLDEPVPQRLKDLLADPPARAARNDAANDRSTGKVIPLRAPAAARPRWRTYVPLAAAALVVLGVGLNMNRVTGPQTNGPTDVALASKPLLDKALEESPSGVPVAMSGQEVLPVSTLRSAGGVWCREFETRVIEGGTVKKSRGIACREEEGHWAMRVIAATGDPQAGGDSGGYQTASGGEGPRFADTIGTHTTLTPAQEAEQLQKKWQ